MNDTLMNCINEVANLSDKDKVNIKGKFYATVDTRVDIFRKHFGSSATILTEIVMHDLDRVVVKATISVKNDGEYLTIGSGFAEEFRGNGMVNKTSALENCETSAIGRGLASCGLGGGAYASSFEVDNAINNKSEQSKGKYKIVDDQGKSLRETNEPSAYLELCREYMPKPDSKQSTDCYAVNKWAVKSAMSSSSGETKKAFQQLISLYEVEGVDQNG